MRFVYSKLQQLQPRWEGGVFGHPRAVEPTLGANQESKPSERGSEPGGFLGTASCQKWRKWLPCASWSNWAHGVL